MILQTRRLIIRKFKPTDLAGLIDMFTDPDVMRYIGPRRPMTEDEIQNWLADILHRQNSELNRYAVALKATEELIGVAGLRDEDGIKDFGYYFRRSHWRKDMHGKLAQPSSTILKPAFRSRITRSSLQMKIQTA